MIQLDGPAIGYRAFHWAGGALRSIGVSTEWPVQKGPQVAKCEGGLWGAQGSREQHPEGSPIEDCTCGIYAHSKPELVQQGIIKAVTIGYGRLIVHPDGWRAEKSEIIGLIAPPKSCQHKLWDAQRDLCKECGCTGQSIARAAPASFFPEMASSLPFTVPNQSPSLTALEILAEQYGARVIQDWDNGIALAQEQGAAPIPDGVYAEAANAGQLETAEGGTFISPVWYTGQWTEGSPTIIQGTAMTEGTVTWKVQTPITINLTTLTTEAAPPDPVKEKLQLKREKRELHAKLWKPDTKAA